MVSETGKALARLGVVAALSVAVLALTACGSSTDPTVGAPAVTAQAPSEASSTPDGDSVPDDTPKTEPQGDVAPKFTLPSAAGESVSLESFAGDKNVVLVFYRGFW